MATFLEHLAQCPQDALERVVPTVHLIRCGLAITQAGETPVVLSGRTPKRIEVKMALSCRLYPYPLILHGTFPATLWGRVQLRPCQ